MTEQDLTVARLAEAEALPRAGMTEREHTRAIALEYKRLCDIGWKPEVDEADKCFTDVARICGAPVNIAFRESAKARIELYGNKRAADAESARDRAVAVFRRMDEEVALGDEPQKAFEQLRYILAERDALATSDYAHAVDDAPVITDEHRRDWAELRPYIYGWATTKARDAHNRLNLLFKEPTS